MRHSDNHYNFDQLFELLFDIFLPDSNNAIHVASPWASHPAISPHNPSLYMKNSTRFGRCCSRE